VMRESASLIGHAAAHWNCVIDVSWRVNRHTWSHPRS
jgi:hypothetical protein